ncbi:hypothetical protein [Streptomyces sp. 5-10]|uniref:hypothetical protein n=1 Tax=Streptomyces sp. 5-10 TaxID=878925 RepID=UPI00168A4A27|nr:hypothetical protein [Streptomyces sp. 5-10]MBD3004575.1 hypothetical protein [Streptomyces sp. 5-10]
MSEAVKMIYTAEALERGDFQLGTVFDENQGNINNARVVRLAMEHGMTLDAEQTGWLEAFEADPKGYEAGEGWSYYDAVTEQGGLSDKATEYLEERTDERFAWVWDTGGLTLMEMSEADTFGYFG